MRIDWDMVEVTLPFGRDGAPDNSPMSFAAIKSYSFLDENLTCEHCHGPGSAHISTTRAIINPKYITAEAERQMCGKCHAYDDAINAKPEQEYGFEYPWNSDFASMIGGGSFVPGIYDDLTKFFANWGDIPKDDEAYWDPGATGGKLYGQAHRQQYTMLAQSKHRNNPYEKLTCTNCHDPHTQYRVSQRVSSGTDQYVFETADYRNNVACLSCHAEFGPFSSIKKHDVANIHMLGNGTVQKNGTTLTPGDDVIASQTAVIGAVGRHMFDKTGMLASYDVADESQPVGRCTTCHMPKVAKSGGYWTGTDADPNANRAIIEGDQASHVFSVIWPWQSTAMSRAGPSFQSGYIGQFVSAGNNKYDMFGFMPNSCSKCHADARRPMLVCNDHPDVWPHYPDGTTWWPFSENPTAQYWKLGPVGECYTTSQAP
jgi:hypothetical protein